MKAKLAQMERMSRVLEYEMLTQLETIVTSTSIIHGQMMTQSLTPTSSIQSFFPIQQTGGIESLKELLTHPVSQLATDMWLKT